MKPKTENTRQKKVVMGVAKTIIRNHILDKEICCNKNLLKKYLYCTKRNNPEKELNKEQIDTLALLWY
ncbi:MAG: hypothetical protein ACI90V_005416 [Bacillariaceae sp.]